MMGVVTLAVASVIIFAATNVLPGDVAEVVLGRNATPELVQSMDEKLRLNESVVSRYGDWISGVVQGDLGESLVAVAQDASQPHISAMISEPLRNSLVLASLALLALVPLSLALGVLAGLRHGKGVDYGISYVAVVIGALPEFVLGTFLIVVFFTQLGWLPPVALVPVGGSPLAHPDALVLPIAALCGASVAFAARQVRAGVVSVLDEEYVRSARLAGLRESRVIRRYVLRNALAPSVQIYAQTLQYMLGGVIVVEALFGYPGIGSLLVNAVSTRDATLVASVSLILAAIYVAINIAADIAVLLLVPKLRAAAR